MAFLQGYRPPIKRGTPIKPPVDIKEINWKEMLNDIWDFINNYGKDNQST